MCNLGEGLYNRAYAEGYAAGYAVGYMKGILAVNTLFRRLFSEKRNEDIRRAIEDKAYLDQLMKEYCLV